MSLGQVRYELLAKNFVCPDFHTCTMLDSLKACEDYPTLGVKGVCQSISTNIVEMAGKGCGFKGRQICYNAPTGFIQSGPNKFMLVVHNELSEKVYKFVAANSNWLLLGSLSALVMGYGSYKLIKEVTATPEYLETADKEKLTELIQKATVSNNHWNGNQISFEGESQKATFSQVSAQIEEIYSKSVNFMRKRQDTYEWSQKPSHPLGFGLTGLLISAPFMLLESGLKTLSSARPELNAEEEQQVRDAMHWRKERYAQLNDFFQQSQDHLNKNSSYLGKFWDKTLDKLGSWREVPLEKDLEILDQMIKTS